MAKATQTPNGPTQTGDKKELLEQLVGGATPTQIEEWKKKYPKGVFSIEVGGHIGYFQFPGRHVLNFVMGNQDPEKPLEYFEIIMKETQIGGSDALQTDDELFFGACEALKDKLAVKKGKLVNY